ncbi:Cas10/Cmr2 second palm domain-containing protein [Acetivibrio cellulolyticus]|uniref:Cas10/Cmr2 second palm domain-containing protein n=1 Tax=Acetivibrio cellulolyticus TaxID=35830 RepID=UPI0001E2FC0E|nr:HD superfamily hydrolase [Acetivibrio cellulolyticus]
MRMFHWKAFIENNINYIQHELPDDRIEWVDKITGTKFYLTHQEYNEYLSLIQKKVDLKNADMIVEYLNTEGVQNLLPYYDGRTEPKITLRDAAWLFVLFSYLYNGNGNADIYSLREESYKAFFGGTRDKFPEAWKALEIVTQCSDCLDKSVYIKILKGGPYKIKKYYLENNDLKDIRGASTLLTYVGEEKIPEIIGKRFIEECLIYSGGGNVFAVLPSWADENIYLELERTFHQYTMGAQNAFYLSEEIKLEDLLINYKSTMYEIEERLLEREKHKIYITIRPKSEFFNDGFFYVEDEKIEFENVSISPGGKCKLCAVREAEYLIKSFEGITACGSCMHKHLTGAIMKKGILKKYKQITGKDIKWAQKSIDDLKDNKGYVSVIYADGNNMGAIVRDIENLADMMFFSRRTSQIAQKALFKSLYEFYPDKFEVVAIGGDDIFVIVPGKDSIEFTARMIQTFNNEFKNLSSEENEQRYSATLSAGICIGKYKTPIRLMVEQAEEKMKNAKNLVRTDKACCNGSLDFVVINDIGQTANQDMSDKGNCGEVKYSLLPYNLERAMDMVNLVKELKNKRVKSSLNGLLRAFEKAESKLEMQLFYSYNQVRNKNNINNNIKSITGLKFENGILVSSLEDGRSFSPWRDILEMWDFCGGEN